MGEIIEYEAISWDRRNTKERYKKVEEEKEQAFIEAVKAIREETNIITEEKMCGIATTISFIGMLFHTVNFEQKQRSKEMADEIERLVTTYFTKREKEKIEYCLRKVNTWLEKIEYK